MSLTSLLKPRAISTEKRVLNVAILSIHLATGTVDRLYCNRKQMRMLSSNTIESLNNFTKLVLTCVNFENNFPFYRPVHFHLLQFTF